MVERRYVNSKIPPWLQCRSSENLDIQQWQMEPRTYGIRASSVQSVNQQAQRDRMFRRENLFSFFISKKVTLYGSGTYMSHKKLQDHPETAGTKEQRVGMASHSMIWTVIDTQTHEVDKDCKNVNKNQIKYLSRFEQVWANLNPKKDFQKSQTIGFASCYCKIWAISHVVRCEDPIKCPSHLETRRHHPWDYSNLQGLWTRFSSFGTRAYSPWASRVWTISGPHPAARGSA